MNKTLFFETKPVVLAHKIPFMIYIDSNDLVFLINEKINENIESLDDNIKSRISKLAIEKISFTNNECFIDVKIVLSANMLLKETTGFITFTAFWKLVDGHINIYDISFEKNWMANSLAQKGIAFIINSVLKYKEKAIYEFIDKNVNLVLGDSNTLTELIKKQGIALDHFDFLFDDLYIESINEIIKFDGEISMAVNETHSLKVDRVVGRHSQNIHIDMDSNFILTNLLLKINEVSKTKKPKIDFEKIDLIAKNEVLIVIKIYNQALQAKLDVDFDAKNEKIHLVVEEVVGKGNFINRMIGKFVNRKSFRERIGNALKFDLKTIASIGPVPLKNDDLIKNEYSFQLNNLKVLELALTPLSDRLILDATVEMDKMLLEPK